MPRDYEFHSAANIFPLDDEHTDELAKDIKAHGLLVKIAILDGKILDGRRRGRLGRRRGRLGRRLGRLGRQSEDLCRSCSTAHSVFRDFGLAECRAQKGCGPTPRRLRFLFTGEINMSTELLAHAGDEATVRGQVKEAMAEAKPLPEWQTTTEPTKPVNVERQDTIRLTSRMSIQAFTSGASDEVCHWYSVAHVQLVGFPYLVPTAETRLILLRHTLVAIDEARPVLVRLIENAETAANQDAPLEASEGPT